MNVMDYSKHDKVKTKEEDKKMGFFDKLFGTSKEVQKIDKDNQRIDELKKTSIKKNKRIVEGSKYNKDSVCDLAYALCCLATCIGEASVYVEPRGPKDAVDGKVYVRVFAYWDESKLFSRGVRQLASIEDYKRLKVPTDIALFLMSVPFVNWKYELFVSVNEYSSDYKERIMNRMKEGCARSHLASISDIDVMIRDIGGIETIVCYMD